MALRLHPFSTAMNWAIWITGPPGSGKTTLARDTAAALADEGQAGRHCDSILTETDVLRAVVQSRADGGTLARRP